MIRSVFARALRFVTGKTKKSVVKRIAKQDFDRKLKDALLESSRSKLPKSLDKVADLYGVLGLPFKSIDCLSQIPLEMRTSDTWLRLAVAYAKIGDMDSCAESLNKAEPAALTEARANRYHLLKCQLFLERGDFQGLLSYLSGLPGELTNELEVQRLEALSALGHEYEASVGFHGLMSRPGIKTGISKAAIGYFHRTNDHATALALIRDAQNRWPTDISLQAALCRTYWSMGSMPDFVDAVRKSFGFEDLVTDPIVGHALKAMKIDPSVSELLDGAMKRIQARTKKSVYFSSLKLAHTACQAGRYDIAKDIAERYLKRGGVAPMARYILALCKLANGQNRAAFHELKAVLSDVPYLDAGYHFLYTAAATSEDLVNEIEGIISSKRAKVARFRLLDRHGRRVHQNPDLIALHYINGNYEMGLEEKINRRVINSLNYFTPDNRPHVGGVVLSGGKSLFLIVDDGVSDEVRWAQYLPRLSQRFDRIESTCEPRLLGIMERSFPTIRFHPVNRIWGESPKRFADLRKDVPNWELAHYLDGNILRALNDFETVAFTNEVVLSAVKEKGTLAPETVPGGYLVPDPLLKEAWRRKVSNIAGSRKRIGVLWRSSVIDRKRSRFYFELESLRHLMALQDCELFSLQHAANPEELKWCSENGIHILDVDLFNDFEGIAAIASEMDVVLGPSTLPTEMSAAVGTPTIIPGVNFETVAIRLHKGAGASCRHTKNAFVACDPDGYSDPEADQVDRLHRVMSLIAEEIRTGRNGSGLKGY